MNVGSLIAQATPGPEDPASRTTWLFRDSLREGHVHPLMALIQHHRGTTGAAELGAELQAMSMALTCTPPHDQADAPQLAMRWLQQHGHHLPACPEVVLQAQRALQREDISLDELAERIACDQALAARTLRIANCSLYGVVGRISTIRQALGILGLRCVATLLNAAALTASSEALVGKGFDLHDFWRHSLGTALCAREIARLRELDEDLAFNAGLLHDLGRLALAHAPRLAPGQALPQGLDKPPQHVDHTELGACVGRLWHFSPQVVHVLSHHHAPPERTGTLDVLDAVHLADATVHALDLAGRQEELVPAVSHAVWQRAALSETEWLAVFGATEQMLGALCDALGVSPAPPGLRHAGSAD